MISVGIDVSKDKLSDFVEEYWHYDTITQKSADRFIEDYRRWARKKGYHANEVKAKAIYAMACEGIPTLSSSAASTKMLTREAIRVLREVNQTLESILTQMQTLATHTSPEYGIVRAMNGVGDVLAPRLIAEIGDVRRFHSGNALEKDRMQQLIIRLQTVWRKLFSHICKRGFGNYIFYFSHSNFTVFANVLVWKQKFS